MVVKGIELNGLPVAEVEFAFNAKGIVITCKHTNATTKDAELIKLYFNGIGNIVTDWRAIDDTTDVKIISAELEDSNDKQKAAFKFATGAKNPEINLAFDYTTVHYSW